MMRGTGGTHASDFEMGEGLLGDAEMLGQFDLCHALSLASFGEMRAQFLEEGRVRGVHGP